MRKVYLLKINVLNKQICHRRFVDSKYNFAVGSHTKKVV